MGVYSISNQKVETEIHKIIQYLAAACNSFLVNKKDDSHTSLKSLIGCGCLTTRPLNNNGDVLAFSYSSFTIEWWIGDTGKIKFPLEGKMHKEVLDWITARAKENGIEKPFIYKMHYDLPYEVITDDYIFHLENKTRLGEIMHYRIMAHIALEDTIRELTSHSEIRVWPHHFDIASLYTFNKGKRHTIGLGMAIPDDVSSNFYLYTRGYAGEKPVKIANTNKLDSGYWNPDFNGAVLELNDNSTIESCYHFFSQAAQLLKTEGRI